MEARYKKAGRQATPVPILLPHPPKHKHTPEGRAVDSEVRRGARLGAREQRRQALVVGQRGAERLDVAHLRGQARTDDIIWSIGRRSRCTGELVRGAWTSEQGCCCPQAQPASLHRFLEKYPPHIPQTSTTTNQPPTAPLLAAPSLT